MLVYPNLRSSITTLAASAAIAVMSALPTPSSADDGRNRTQRKTPPNAEAMAHGEGSTARGCKRAATSGPDSMGPVGAAPFRFSINGAPDTGEAPHDADTQRCADLALTRADIQVKFDGLHIEPRLNVVASPDAAKVGGRIVFATSTNYGLLLTSGEVRIFQKGTTPRQTPLVVLPLDRGTASWIAPRDVGDEVQYVLRVYDDHGRFDETAPKVLDIAKVRAGKIDARDLMTSFDGNALEVRNIPISGGNILVSGRGVAPGHSITVMGAEAPIDSKGDFAIRQIVPSGTHLIDVVVSDKKGVVTSFQRSATIPTHDFFYVALADLTVGRGTASGPIDIVAPAKADDYKDKVNVNGRLAFYLKGKISGETLLTAAADTRDQPLRHMFSNFDSKDPRYLLRNLDPNRYYPVYGDDSTLHDDAPTRGKFYVRLERGDNNIMWGNFKTTVNGTEYVRYERGLYGARAQAKTAASTSYGERRGTAEFFVAEPGTLGGRDVFRGTGGSLYYLRRANITMGSERVTIEARDRATGLVVKTRVLAPTQDYDVNYLQGRILLKTPLASTGTSELIVSGGPFVGVEQYLVVNYEYTPGLTATKDSVVGGRGAYWIGDHIQVGVTGYDQSASAEKLRIGGADVTLRYKPGTYVKFEAARSSGPGSGDAISLDGGYTFDTRITAGAPAWAKRIEAGIDLKELISGADGRIAAFWKDKDKDYSGPGELAIGRASREAGVIGSVKMSDRWSTKTKLDARRDEFRDYTAAEQNVTYTYNEYWKTTVGARLDDNKVQMASASRLLNQNGRRSDVAAKVEYDSNRDWTVYGIGQVTVVRTGDRDPANRIGVGGTLRLNEKTKTLAEISTGNGGLGGKAGIEYKIDEARTSHLNYEFNPDRTDIISRGGAGTFSAGTRYRFSDNFAVFMEERVKHGGGFSGLTHAYGLDFVPAEKWKMSVALEVGKVSDPYAGDIKRNAASLSLGYGRDGLTYAGKVEYRHDDIVRNGVAQERDTYVTTNTLNIKMAKDWRYVGKFNASYSDSNAGDFFRGNYVEAVTGFAYRPVADDRLNALFKHTYFYDLPSPGQRLGVGGFGDFSQKSNVLSVDASYDVVAWLTVGGKYAFRTGELRDNKAAGPWFESRAQLLIARADIHFVKEWDFVAEWRRLQVSTAEDEQTGALVALYRHLGDNFKVGVGYNFTSFSDDLTNLSSKNRGVFLNAIGKF